MKLLVCHDKLDDDKQIEETYQELMNYVEDVEFLHAYCDGLTDHGPHIIQLPEIQFYSRVTKDKVCDLLQGNLEAHKVSVEQLYHPEMDEYRSNPMHRRNVKLFRYQLEKMLNLDWRSLREIMPMFCQKYDVDIEDLGKAVRLAIIGTTKGPDLPKLICSLGKDQSFLLIDKYLQDNKNRI